MAIPFRLCLILTKSTRRKEIALSNTLFKQLLGVNKVIIENIREEPDPSPNGAGWRLVIDVRPYSRDRKRCPVCGRKCPGCDKPAKPRLWRCPDCNGIRTFLSYTPCRVRCPEHGAKQEALMHTHLSLDLGDLAVF